MITIAIAAVALLGVASLLVLAANKPDTFRVQRATRIKAPPEKIFALINDLHRWQSWSLYEKVDPEPSAVGLRHYQRATVERRAEGSDAC
jgi:hypothetical protein